MLLQRAGGSGVHNGVQLVGETLQHRPLVDRVIIAVDVYKRQALCRSATYRSRRPMATGSPLMPRTQFFSHWVSCGQTRPHTAGSEECCEIDSKAASS